MKILFVEDTEVFISRFKPMLEALGEVVHFKSSNAARKAMGREEEKFDFDLVVCDHNILRFEEECKVAYGTEIYYHLRNWNDSKIPFIHFSAYPCPERYKDSETDENFYTMGKDYDSPLNELIEEINYRMEE